MKYYFTLTKLTTVRKPNKAPAKQDLIPFPSGFALCIPGLEHQMPGNKPSMIAIII